MLSRRATCIEAAISKAISSREDIRRTSKDNVSLLLRRLFRALVDSKYIFPVRNSYPITWSGYYQGQPGQPGKGPWAPYAAPCTRSVMSSRIDVGTVHW